MIICQIKEKQMTDTAFRKKREKTHIDFADVYTKAAYDMFPSEMIKKLKEKDNFLKEKDNFLKEKDNVLKEKDNVLKEKERMLNRLITRLYFQEQKTKESIAELVGLPIETIDSIILNTKIV